MPTHTLSRSAQNPLRLAHLLLALGLLSACAGADGDAFDTSNDTALDTDSNSDTDDSDSDTDDSDSDTDDSDSDTDDSDSDTDDSDSDTDDSDTDDSDTDDTDSDSDDTDDTDPATDADADGFSSDVDCDDSNPNAHPGAIELCNGFDDNCDELVDDDSSDDAQDWFADSDLDGFGDPAATVRACQQPSDHLLDNTDCDDTTAERYPGNTEICDTLDNDCDELADDDDDDVVGAPTWFADSDGDAFGDSQVSVTACVQPHGHVENGTDCDDVEATTNPGADEVCDDVDNDCDTLADDEDDSVVDGVTWYADVDLDGFGDPSSGKRLCVQPEGFVTDPGDCDDGDDAVHPEASEICDERDNNCDGDVDDDDADLVGGQNWYIDNDDDGYGDDTTTPTLACERPPSYSADNTDCDDHVRTVNPSMPFDFDDDYDNDCDSNVDEDVGSETYSHDSDIQHIWNSFCTRCHGSSGGLSLTSAYGNIVDRSSSLSGMPYVTPGLPSDSYLWRKLNNTHLEVGGSGGQMPFGGPSLSSSDLDKIASWIREGAVR